MLEKLKKFEMNPMFAASSAARQTDMPDPVCDVGGYFIEDVELRDGAKLKTKVIVPDKGENWPCLYTRTPYPLFWEMEPTVMLPFVKQGYVVVIQACRGTNGSEGTYEPFQNERNDGIDAINWLVKQNWHNKKIATYGGSYMSYTQWIIADKMPAEVITSYLDCFGINRYSQMYMNGMFRHDMYTSWAVQNGGVKADNEAQIYDQALTIRPHNTFDEKLLGQKLPFYQKPIATIERNDPYWQDSFWQTLLEMPAKIDRPVFIGEGWFDHNVEGVMTAIKGLRPEIRKKSKILIGPWDHVGNFPGDRTYPNGKKHGEAHVKSMVEWFDRMLRGKGLDKPLKSEIYAIGEGKWHEIDSWPPKTNTMAFYPAKAGNLCPTAGDNESASYLYDPKDPVTTVGGNALLAWMGKLGHTPHGPRFQPTYEDRNDVLVFKSEPLDTPSTIMGSIDIKLSVKTTAPDTSFMVKVSEEFSDGRTLNIVDGATSILLRNESDHLLDYTPNEKIMLDIRLWDTAWNLQAGSRLRFDITSSNFPMYHVHPNKKGVWSEIESVDTATQTIFFGAEETMISLPIYDSQETVG
ncbi:CocE/NonD family hydrolase [Enterococcus sp. 22-H-5-01]|uniref:CocE/NonD family hydrolase n=1 Tax=Enterococcus sp. 22-H-5-01 TaxID=3418555 RepID=UPI003D05A3BC